MLLLEETSISISVGGLLPKPTGVQVERNGHTNKADVGTEKIELCLTMHNHFTLYRFSPTRAGSGGGRVQHKLQADDTTLHEEVENTARSKPLYVV